MIAELPAAGRGVNGVTYERWDGSGGNRLTKGNRTIAGKQAAAAKGLVTSLELPAGVASAHVTRVRGYFVAPRSGELQFVLTSDDNSEFWFSRGEDPFARERMAWIAGDGMYGWTKPGETGRIPSQWTAPIKVEQSKRYYFEALHKQGGAKGHLIVRMRYKGEKDAVTIPASALQPWLGIGTDADDDGLPDEWQNKNGLDGQEERGSFGDPDGDGVSNFGEFVAGSGPADPAPVNGMLLWEAWYGVRGSQVVDLTSSPRFAGPPDYSAFVAGASTPLMKAGNSGARLSGCIVPAESGEYVLGVTGDDVAELWLSDNESPLRKERVAYSTYWLKKDYWQLPPSQQSKPVTLEAGRPYYFEIILKDSVAPGWAALGWKKKGEEKFTEVPKAFLRSPGVFEGDKDRNMLPDNWERQMLSRFTETAKSKIVLTEHGDPDRDGLPNWLEERWQTNPLEKSQVIGALVTEWWHGISSRSLDKSREAGVFLKRPSMVEISRSAASKADTADWFASRRRGYVVAPVTGRYRFWVAGDDQVEFWISSDGSKFHKKLTAEVKPYSYQSPTAMVCTQPSEWDARHGQQSVEIELKAGESYFIELLQTEGLGNDHVALAWQRREAKSQKWSEREQVPASALISYEGDEDDLDDDYLPDSWETKTGLDPKDNGSKDLAKQGERGDHDGDRLTNREEFLLGTNPCVADSDGDGVNDYDEVKLYGSDPVRRDASPPVKHADLPLAEYVGVPGTWMPTEDGALRSATRRGSVDFPFQIAAPGIYLIELDAKVLAAEGYAAPVPIAAKVDGVQVGTSQVTTDGGKFVWLTPWLEAGTHAVTIDNRNTRLGVNLEIRSLSIYRHEGEDLNRNSIPDWMEGLFRQLNGVDASFVESAVSPACIEGSARFATGNSLVADGKAVEIKKGLEGRWYADVPLDSDETTALSVSFENGALKDKRGINWTATNLFEAGDRITIRKGDSLKVMAVPAGAKAGSSNAILKMDEKQLATSKDGAPQVVTFEKPGRFVLSADVTAGTEALTAKVEVEVIEADFGPTFHLAAGSPRTWSLPGVPSIVAIENDEGLQLSDTLPVGKSKKLKASYINPRAATPTVLARLWDSGPIVSSTSVNVFRIVSASESRDVRVVGVMPDGTRIVEISFMIDGVVPPDLSVWIEFFVTDAVFENGDTRYELTADDFDENGMARLRMFKAPGEGVAYICHWIRPYDSEEPLEEPAAEVRSSEAGE